VFGYVVPASKHSARSGLACGDTTALFSELPLCLFVPSLSWLNDQFKFGKLDQSGPEPRSLFRCLTLSPATLRKCPVVVFLARKRIPF
jgi:hypothetical protein